MEATSPTAWISDAVQRNELVAVVGTGVSMGLTDGKISALSWKGLVRDGFAFGAKKGKITSNQVEAWKPQLVSSDLDDLLGAARVHVSQARCAEWRSVRQMARACVQHGQADQ
jgi:hypothetical protein